MLRDLKKTNDPSSFLTSRTLPSSQRQTLYNGPASNQGLKKKILARLQAKEVNDDFFAESKGMPQRNVQKKEKVTIEEQIKNLMFSSISDNMLQELYRHYLQLRLKRKLSQKKEAKATKSNSNPASIKRNQPNEKYFITQLCTNLGISIGSILGIPELSNFGPKGGISSFECTPYVTRPHRKSVIQYDEENEDDYDLGGLGELSSLNRRKYETNLERLQQAIETGMLTSTSKRSSLPKFLFLT